MAQMLTLAADPDRFHLIDVCDAENYATAHVAGAEPIPLADLGKRASELPAGKTTVTAAARAAGGPPTAPTRQMPMLRFSAW